MRSRTIATLVLAGAACLVSACGGGGGGGGSGVASTPTAPPPPPPPTSQAVTIFSAPAPGQYASVGVSTQDDLIAIDDRLTTISSAGADQVQIRYNAGGFYEILMPGATWDRLVHYKGLQNPTSANNYFQPEDVPQNLGYLLISKSRDNGYGYSELAAWGNVNLTAEDGFGWVAFGTPTPSGSVPTTGSATYSGIVAGTADIMTPDFLIGGHFPSSVEGTVSLLFNFGTGTLGGSTTLTLQGGMNPIPLGTFNFTDTVYSMGSTSYSGKFQTNVAGPNFFLGQFTGPNAQETIGAWAIPFIYSGDGQAHQAMGAWIAKRP